MSIDHEYVALVRKTVEEEDFFGRAAANDRESRYPIENIAALKRIGVPSMHVAAAFGGPAHTPSTQAAVVEQIAYGDPTTAACVNMHWVVADILAKNAADNADMAALLGECASEQAMFAGGASIPANELDAAKVGASFRRVDGGWQGSGRVGFATNSEGATYTGTIGALVDDDGEPIDRTVVVVKPPLDTPGVELQRDWDALGLRGSATHTIQINDAFIERRYGFELDLDTLKPGLQAEGSDRASYSVRGGRSQISKAAMWLGLCQRIVDYTQDFMEARKGTTGVNVQKVDTSRRADVTWAQATFGRLCHWVNASRHVIYGTIAEISDEAMDPTERAEKILIAMYQARRMCEEVAKESFRLGGAHGIVAARPYERMYRDLMAYVATAYKAPELEEHLGRAALGRSFAVNASGG